MRIDSGGSAGSEQALTLLWERHHAQLTAWLRQRAESPEQAEDVAMEAWLKVLTNIYQLDEEQAFRAWINRIARNELYSRLRRRRGTRESSLVQISARHRLPGTLIEHSYQIDHYPEIAHVRDVFTELSIDTREILAMVSDGYNCAEIAATLGISYSAAQSRTYRAKQEYSDMYGQLTGACEFAGKD